MLPFHQSGLLSLDSAGQELLPASLGPPDGGEEEDVEDDEGHAGHQVDTDHSEPVETIEVNVFEIQDPRGKLPNTNWRSESCREMYFKLCSICYCNIMYHQSIDLFTQFKRKLESERNGNQIDHQRFIFYPSQTFHKTFHFELSNDARKTVEVEKCREWKVWKVSATKT